MKNVHAAVLLSKKDKEKKTWVENIQPLRLLCIQSCNLDGKIIT